MSKPGKLVLLTCLPASCKIFHMFQVSQVTDMQSLPNLMLILPTCDIMPKYKYTWPTQDHMPPFFT